MKRLIISADDFGHSEENNNAIMAGVKSGIITSTGILVNMPGFEHAIKEIFPQISVDLGLHFNIFEGKSLTKSGLLCDSFGNFNISFPKLLMMQNNKKIMNAIETELAAQIEKILAVANISHIDSHCHYHAIPAVFDLFVKYAEKYDIKYIRTQQEPFYAVKSKLSDKRFPLNVVKHVLLNELTAINKKRIKNSKVKTNGAFIGVLYTGYMDEEAIIRGIRHVKSELTEVIFHPYLPKNPEQPDRQNNYNEFLITQNPSVKEKILKAGFELTDFSKVS